MDKMKSLLATVAFLTSIQLAYAEEAIWILTIDNGYNRSNRSNKRIISYVITPTQKDIENTFEPVFEGGDGPDSELDNVTTDTLIIDISDSIEVGSFVLSNGTKFIGKTQQLSGYFGNLPLEGNLTLPDSIGGIYYMTGTFSTKKHWNKIKLQMTSGTIKHDPNLDLNITEKYIEIGSSFNLDGSIFGLAGQDLKVTNIEKLKSSNLGDVLGGKMPDGKYKLEVQNAPNGCINSFVIFMKNGEVARLEFETGSGQTHKNLIYDMTRGISNPTSIFIPKPRGNLKTSRGTDGSLYTDITIDGFTISAKLTGQNLEISFDIKYFLKLIFDHLKIEFNHKDGTKSISNYAGSSSPVMLIDGHRSIYYKISARKSTGSATSFLYNIWKNTKQMRASFFGEEQQSEPNELNEKEILFV